MRDSEYLLISFRILVVAFLGVTLLSFGVLEPVGASTVPLDHPRGVLEGFIDRVADSPGAVPGDSVSLTDSSRRAVGTFLLSALDSRAKDRPDTNMARAVEEIRARYGLPASNCDLDPSASIPSERTDQFFRDVSTVLKDHVNGDSIDRSERFDTGVFSDVRYYERDDRRWFVNLYPNLARAPLLTLERRDEEWVLGGFEWAFGWLIRSALAPGTDPAADPRRIDPETYERILAETGDTPPVRVRLTDLDVDEKTTLEFEVKSPLLPNLAQRNVGSFADGDFTLGALRTEGGTLSRHRYGRFWDSSLSYGKYDRACDGLVNKKRVRLDSSVDFPRLTKLRGTIRLSPPTDFDTVAIEPGEFVTPFRGRGLNGYLYRVDPRRFLLDVESLPEDLWIIRGFANESVPLERASGSNRGPLKLTFESKPERVRFYHVTDRFEREYPVSVPLQIDRNVLKLSDSRDTGGTLPRTEVLDREKGTTVHLDLSNFSVNMLEVYGLTPEGEPVHLTGRSVLEIEGVDHQLLKFSRSVDRLVVFTNDG